MSKEIIIKYTDEEMKVFKGISIDPQEWLQNAWNNRARQAIDEYVTKSGQGSRFTPKEKKLEIIKKLKIETAAERQVRIEKKMKEK